MFDRESNGLAGSLRNLVEIVRVFIFYFDQVYTWPRAFNAREKKQILENKILPAETKHRKICFDLVQGLEVSVEGIGEVEADKLFSGFSDGEKKYKELLFQKMEELFFSGMDFNDDAVVGKFLWLKKQGEGKGIDWHNGEEVSAVLKEVLGDAEKISDFRTEQVAKLVGNKKEHLRFLSILEKIAEVEADLEKIAEQKNWYKEDFIPILKRALILINQIHEKEKGVFLKPVEWKLILFDLW